MQEVAAALSMELLAIEGENLSFMKTFGMEENRRCS